MKSKIKLFPEPNKFIFNNGFFNFNNEDHIMLIEDTSINKVGKQLKIDIQDIIGVPFEIIVHEQGSSSFESEIIFKKNDSLSKQEYKLLIESNKIIIEYSTEEGAFYATRTLKQIIIQQKKSLNCLTINDKPSFKNRGIMIDISRNKIPKLKTIFKLIDLASDLKLNQLQLYIEGFSFAYPSFKDMWSYNTPLTGEEIIQIDKYCKSKFIELVPNQNSFGHMEAWLERPEFKDIAEKPNGFYRNGEFRKAGTLDPSDDRSLELIKNIYNDILPYFSSNKFNVGCDETFELGEGKSKDLCERKGKGRVYLEYLLDIYKLTKDNNMKMLFWSDIIIKYPELIKELPKDLVALEWGYESEHPFEDHCRKLNESGIDFYVCPGTSSWNSLTGRTKNMKKNLLKAAKSGIKFNSIGYLITDWGDNGHWQHLPFSYPGYIYGASLSWGPEKNEDIEIDYYLNNILFKDNEKTIGKLTLDLGNYYLNEKNKLHNKTNLFNILNSPIEDIEVLENIDKKDLLKIEEQVKTYEENLNKVELNTEDSNLIEVEYRNAIRFIQIAIKVGLYKYENIFEDKEINKKSIINLVDSISLLIKKYKKIWHKRNKISEIDKSIRQLSKLKKYFKNIL